MPSRRRAQILMEPEEYDELTRIAEAKRVSVAELIRTAVRVVYLRSRDDRLATVDRIAAMELPIDSWDQMKSEIEAAYDAGIP
jgi:predicted DNA-binding ribbon-helix-helix protein